MGDLKIQVGEQALAIEDGQSAEAILRQAKAFDKTTIAASLNGTVIDLSDIVTDSGELAPVKTDSEQGLDVLRHSSAHMMAQVVLRNFPDAKLAIGPTVENGFYYDFDFGDQTFSAEDFPKIEKEMKKLVNQKIPIERKVISRKDALAMWEPEGELYKVELIKDLPEDAVISTYSQGEFTDLCRGPHVPHTGHLRVFKLMSVAGAYWRGDEKNKMLTRIYGTAWAAKKDLADYQHRLREAEKRDHRKLGKQLEIYHISDEVGKGLPLWLPNGMAIRDQLEKFAHEIEWKYGYKNVKTPEITKEGLYITSGHLSHYKDAMFPPMTLDDENEAFYLKPMNCPHHHMIFNHRPRSYREMPLRLAEYGQVYRYEKSGELAGLLRVRGMCMNDAHIYCTKEQLPEEFKAVMRMHLEYYDTFGFDNYYMRLSLHDPDKDKFVNDPDLWKKAEAFCQATLDELELDYKVAYGEAAFYGPKVDVQFKNVIGREETNSTNQVDFVSAERFDLTYIGADNKPHRPAILHRAPLGTHERFIAFLIEHFGGAFPTWLAPTQVVILPVANEYAEYAENLRHDLWSSYVRVEVDNSDESLGKKVRTAISKRKIPNVLVIGENERANNQVTLRQYGVKAQRTMTFEEFKVWLFSNINERKLPERDVK